MLQKRHYGNITWIDILSPKKEDIKKIIEEYDVHPLAAEQLLTPTLRPKVDIYNHHLYLILHFPLIKHSRIGKHEQEVDFIIGKTFLITAHYQPLEVLDTFAKRIDTDKKEKSEAGSVKDAHSGYLFYEIMQEFFSDITEDLDGIKKSLKEIEAKIFAGEEHKMVKALSTISKKLLDFRVITRPHREVLESLRDVGKDFFGYSFAYQLDSLVGEHYRIYSFFESSRETLADLRETNDSLLMTKTNDTMRILTILAFVTFPLSLVASIFGMNTKVLPIVGHPNDFWIILTGMLVATSLFFLFFWYKKWL